MSKSVKIVNSALFKKIRELILSARNTVVRNIDTIQVVTNFEIGRRIVEQEQKGKNRAEYGKTLIKELASKLTIEFGSGFSKRNLDYMRKFYLIYSDKTRLIVQTLSAQFKKSQMLSDQSQKPRTSFVQLAKAESLSRKFTLSWSH